MDRGARYGPEGGPAVDEERFMEIWNLVFMQNEVDDHAQVLGELPAKNIDTGSSLERLATVLNGLDSFFETDLMQPLLEVVESLSGKRYGVDEHLDVSLRIVAEHGRSITFLIADGVQPSNEGRGYVLRRMLRRIVSHARRLGIQGGVTEPLVDRTAEMLSDAYPELAENRAFVAEVAGSEEERFSGTLRQGMELFRGAVARVSRGRELPGDVVFKLHDTFGFPRELTEELVADQGLTADWAGFDALMDQQRRRAKEAVKKGKMDERVAAAAARAGASEFIGYTALVGDGRVTALVAEGGAEVASEGEQVLIVLARTPFYAEGGGQIGDAGLIRTATGLVRVSDAQWAPGNAIVHSGVVESGEIREGDDAHAEVDAVRREATARAHTATHVVHWTLKHVLGEHARQAGSLVGPGRLRFDFPHHSAVPPEVLEQAEELANRRLAQDDPVRLFETTFEEAKRLGAVALFGEKYGDIVRVAEIGDYSRELCGGTHVPRTGNVALVRIVHEAGIGAGMRRVEAVVGPDALREINLERRLLDDIVQALGAGDPKSAPERARQVVQELKQLQSELGKLRKEDVGKLVDEIAGRASQVARARLVASLRTGMGADELRELAQAAAGKLENEAGAAVVLGSRDGGKALIVAACSKNMVARGVTAPLLLEPAAGRIGGGAGGKPILGFAGGPRGDAVEGALEAVADRLEELLRTDRN